MNTPTTFAEQLAAILQATRRLANCTHKDAASAHEVLVCLDCGATWSKTIPTWQRPTFIEDLIDAVNAKVPPVNELECAEALESARMSELAASLYEWWPRHPGEPESEGPDTICRVCGHPIEHDDPKCKGARVRAFIRGSLVGPKDKWGLWNTDQKRWVSDDDGHFGSYTPKRFPTHDAAQAYADDRSYLVPREIE